MGSSLNHEEAYPYPEDHPWLRGMVHDAKAFGRRLVLRQVCSPHENLKAALERDIEATPAPVYVVCPACGR